MNFELQKTDEKQCYHVITNDPRIADGDYGFYREYQKSLGNSRYVGHVPGGYEWVVQLVTAGEYEMNILKTFRLKKEAVAFLETF